MLSKASLQARVGQWVLKAFGSFIATSRQERALRIVEEAVELAQAEGIWATQVALIVDRVYSRPIGTPRAEAGGVGVTYLAYCEAFGEDHRKLIETELARINTPAILERCRAKQREKVAAGTGFDENSIRRVGSHGS